MSDLNDFINNLSPDFLKIYSSVNKSNLEKDYSYDNPMITLQKVDECFEKDIIQEINSPINIQRLPVGLVPDAEPLESGACERLQLVKEIDDVFNNLESNDSSCSILYSKNNSMTLVGLNFYTSSFNYSFLTPNLFRKCFVQKNIPIPNICPNFEKNNVIKNYLPLLLDKKYIKGFLYFNYSSDIYNNNPFSSSLTDVMRLKINNILRSKRATNYGNYTQAPVIFNYIYSQNSLLIQLLNFNKVLQNAQKSYTNQRVIKSFQIPWNVLLYCSCNNNVVEFDNTNTNNPATRLQKVINQTDLNAINLLNLNNSISLILTVLQYALQVYSDILIEIEYFMLSKNYNRPSYMNVSNLELLNKLYNNYVVNQKIVDESLINYKC